MLPPSTAITASSVEALHSAGPVAVWLVVLTFVFLECAVIVGLFLPGDSMLLTAGVVMASRSAALSEIGVLALGAMLAAVAGNQVGYVIGERTGHHLVARKNGRYFNAENLMRVAGQLQRHGFVAVLVARWIPWVRTLCPLVAGAAQMNHRQYTVASTIGAVIWAPVLLLIGYCTGNVLEQFAWVMPIVMGVMVVGLIVGTILGIRQYRREMAGPTEDFDLPTPARRPDQPAAATRCAASSNIHPDNCTDRSRSGTAEARTDPPDAA